MNAHDFAIALIDVARDSVAEAVAQLYHSNRKHLFSQLESDDLAGELWMYLYYCLYDLIKLNAAQNSFYQEALEEYLLLLSADLTVASVENTDMPESADSLQLQIDLFPQFKETSYKQDEQPFDINKTPEAVLIRSLGYPNNPQLTNEAYLLAANIGRRLFKLLVNNSFHDAKPIKLDLSDLLS